MISSSRKLVFHFLRIGKLLSLCLVFRFQMNARVINLFIDKDAANSGRRPEHLHPLLKSIFGDSKLNLVNIGARGGLSADLSHFSNYLITTMFQPDLKEFELFTVQYENDKSINIMPYAVRNGSRARLHITSEPAVSSILEPRRRVELAS